MRNRRHPRPAALRDLETSGHRRPAPSPRAAGRRCAAWPRSCAMWVKKRAAGADPRRRRHRLVEREVRRMRRARSASTTRTSSPSSSGQEASGMRSSRSGRRTGRSGSRGWSRRRASPAPAATSVPATQSGPSSDEGHQLRHVLVAGLADRLEGIREDAPQVGQRPLVAVERDRPLLQRVEAPQLVEAEDVVGVAVRVEHRVDAGQLEAQGLGPQVRGGVDQDRGAAGQADEDRRPRAGCRADRSTGRRRRRSRSSARPSTCRCRET